MEQADKIWMDGKIVDWNDAHVHLISNTLQYGFGVFEATHGTAPKYADKDVINPSSVMLSGSMMFDFMGWKEVGHLIEEGIDRTIQQKRVTYDLERLMPGATKVSTSDFATAIIDNMQTPATVGR